MILVSTDKERFDFTLLISGHAGYAPIGRDVVCAAASTLFFTLWRSVCLMDEEGELVKKSLVSSRGYGKISFTVKESAAPKATALFDSLVTGFELLWENYGRYIRLTKGA